MSIEIQCDECKGYLSDNDTISCNDCLEEVRHEAYKEGYEDCQKDNEDKDATL
jgi:hypothetical protein